MSATQVTVITVVGQIGEFLKPPPPPKKKPPQCFPSTRCSEPQNLTRFDYLGALIGSTLSGYLSTFIGRRLAMMVACVFGGALVPAYMLPRGDVLIAPVFFEQWFVGAVWGTSIHPSLAPSLPPPLLSSFQNIISPSHPSFPTNASLLTAVLRYRTHPRTPHRAQPPSPPLLHRRRNLPTRQPSQQRQLHHRSHNRRTLPDRARRRRHPTLRLRQGHRNFPRRSLGVYSLIRVSRPRDDAGGEARGGGCDARV